MAHNLSSMFYVESEGVPWHRLGRAVKGVATAEEAIVAAGLDWRVTKEPIFLGNGKRIDRQYATVRQDSGSVLGVVGEQYAPVQNKEKFSLLDAVVGSKEAIYHTAGALGDGERVWLLAKLPGHIKVTNQDVVEKFILLHDTFDGSSALEIMLTPTRVVCQNTLNAALRSASNKQKLRHSRNIGLRVGKVGEALGIVREQFNSFEETAQALTKVQFNGEKLTSYLQTLGLAPKTDAEKAAQSTRAKNILEEVSKLFEKGKGNDLPGVKGTAWAAYNAITEYVDHHRSVKGGKENAAVRLEARADSLLFGSGAKLKSEAWDAAVALL